MEYLTESSTESFELDANEKDINNQIFSCDYQFEIGNNQIISVAHFEFKYGMANIENFDFNIKVKETSDEEAKWSKALLVSLINPYNETTTRMVLPQTTKPTTVKTTKETTEKITKEKTTKETTIKTTKEKTTKETTEKTTKEKTTKEKTTRETTTKSTTQKTTKPKTTKLKTTKKRTTTQKHKTTEKRKTTKYKTTKLKTTKLRTTKLKTTRYKTTKVKALAAEDIIERAINGGNGVIVINNQAPATETEQSSFIYEDSDEQYTFTLSQKTIMKIAVSACAIIAFAVLAVFAVKSSPKEDDEEDG